MFAFRADRILAEFDAARPRHRARGRGGVRRARAKLPGGAWQVPLELYQAVPALPIDKAVMEHAERIALVPCDPGWSDLGSWQALWEQQPKDAGGNVVRGDVVLDDAHDCLVLADRRLVACAGVRDLAVIETDDVVLVADRARSEGIRSLVTALKAAGRSEASAHGEEQRPWGSFKVLHEGRGLQGQGDRGRTRRPAQPAEPPASRRALGGGRRHGQDHGRRRGAGARPEPERPHSARRQAPDGESGRASPCT